MSDAVERKEADFADQMQSLCIEAQQQLDRGQRKAGPNLLEMLRPLVLGIEALSRATAENTKALAKLQDASSTQLELPGVINALQQKLDEKDNVNQKLFDALHEELTTYKDQSLLEALHKPVIRDLLILYDDLSELHRQVYEMSAALPQRKARTDVDDKIEKFTANIDHVLVWVMEILARMDVTPLESAGRKLDKTSQRVVGIEPAASPYEDGDIVQRTRLGFNWRGRILRPEEVIMKKWKEGLLVALNQDGESISDDAA